MDGMDQLETHHNQIVCIDYMKWNAKF
jgi:hypothetical protein